MLLLKLHLSWEISKSFSTVNLWPLEKGTWQVISLFLKWRNREAQVTCPRTQDKPQLQANHLKKKKDSNLYYLPITPEMSTYNMKKDSLPSKAPGVAWPERVKRKTNTIFISVSVVNFCKASSHKSIAVNINKFFFLLMSWLSMSMCLSCNVEQGSS